MNLPNLITIARILTVPVIVWAIVSSQMEIAFAIFVIAGVSDAVDGFLAKRFNMASELGALLDPLADKVLVVGTSLSVYPAAGLVEFARDDAVRVVNALELDAVPPGFIFLPGRATEVIPKLVSSWTAGS